MVDISVIILTYNEEQHIERCILSLKPFVKDIFIVDSFSNDNTVEKAKSLGAKVFQNKWINYATQFQWGLDNCPIETQWVMRMDSDEYVLPELSEEIVTTFNSSIEEETSGFYIKRRVHFKDKWIKYGGYYPTWLLRIWRYDHGRIEERWMDEHIKLSTGKTKELEHDLVDDNLNDLTWWTTKHNNYATREAVDILNTIYGFKLYDEVVPDFFGSQEQKRRKLKHVYVGLPLFIRPFIYFLYRYFIKLGFLDGKQGLIWHFLQGFWYRFLVDAKIYEIYSEAGKDRDSILIYLKNNMGIDFCEN
ncbi:glycosyltransferase family 2 protein [Vibrio alginolyticus]|uniref:glycosyltransferase family 2 protein n=1 Tax=Vibrio alginolyticus TaxID=663 RepID=UPI000802E38F|nr:glycosyltransferase family 2 protein [Vibrio alginolyticus]ANP63461.1 glycosyl transferase [Vibrio alginolyticus]